jgi:GT2 family glycosyltransferase
MVASGLCAAPRALTAAALPSVSVVIRSYRRRDSLLTILDVLRVQDHPDYEIVVVEQSGFNAEERRPLDELAGSDPRFRILYSEPLGVGGAREAGWRAAQKEVVLAIDDDDVPLGTDFVSGHARNYLDPDIVAVTGRHVYSPDEVCGYGLRWRARHYCLSYNFFGYPHAFCRFDERIESVDWVHGSNGSVRKSVIERVGGWDARSTDHDEHPFCLRLLNQRKRGERLVFDPSIRLLRRKDLPGGAGVRFSSPERTFQMWLRYYHRLVLRYRPLRSVVLYPIFPLAAAFSALRWIWVDALIYRGFVEKVRVTLRSAMLLPAWYLAELYRSGRQLLQRRWHDRASPRK